MGTDFTEQKFCRIWKQCWKWGWWAHSVCYSLYPTIHVIKNVKRVKCHGFMLIPCPWSKSSWKLTKGSWKSSFSSESREVGISYSIQYTNLIHLLSVSLCFLGTSWTGCSVLCCYLCGQCHHLLLTWCVQQVAMVLESGLITNLKKYADWWREVQYLGYHMGSQQLVS